MHKGLRMNDTVNDMNILIVGFNFKDLQMHEDTCQVIRQTKRSSSAVGMCRFCKQRANAS